MSTPRRQRRSSVSDIGRECRRQCEGERGQCQRETGRNRNQRRSERGCSELSDRAFQEPRRMHISLLSLLFEEAATEGHANGQSSSQSSHSTGSGNMVKTFQAYLPPTNRTYSCVHCRAHLASHDELISKSFQGSQGRAYLFNSVVNVACGQAEERVLLTGLHAVADIYCECCKTPLGWKYEHAFESSQKYKEGKYIIELAHMIKENGWD